MTMVPFDRIDAKVSDQTSSITIVLEQNDLLLIFSKIELYELPRGRYRNLVIRVQESNHCLMGRWEIQFLMLSKTSAHQLCSIKRLAEIVIARIPQQVAE